MKGIEERKRREKEKDHAAFSLCPHPNPLSAEIFSYGPLLPTFKIDLKLDNCLKSLLTEARIVTMSDTSNAFFFNLKEK